MLVDPLPVENPMYWIAFGASVLLLYLTIKVQLTHEDDWINVVRVAILPKLDSFARKQHDLYTVTEVGPEEFVGTVNKDHDWVEKKLDDIGGIRNFASSVHRNNRGQYEVASYAFRKSKFALVPDILALKQVHVTVFQRGGKSDVYAHKEYNSILPIVGLLHFRAKSFSAEEGVKEFQKIWNHNVDNQKIH